MGTTTIEDVSAAAPDAERWFQIYLMSDRAWSKDLVDRGWAHGYSTLVVTIDAPVPGKRLRDVRNGLMMPPKLTMRTAVPIARPPRWCFDVLTTRPLGFAMVDAESELPEAVMSRTFDPRVTVTDIVWLREIWPGKLIVKGAQSVEDAQIVAAAGADAGALSTHGGRQLDRAPLPLELLPAVRAGLDDRVDVVIDGGIMSGADIVAAIALGARAIGIGRGYLYGLMAGGERGVRKVIDLLADDLRTTMPLLGVTTLSDLRPEHVRFRDRSTHHIDALPLERI